MKLTDRKLQEIIENNNAYLDLTDLKEALNTIIENNISLDDYIKQEIKGELEMLETDSLVDLFQDYCEENNYFDDEFTPLTQDNIDFALQNLTPYELLKLDLSDFDINNDYFKYNGFGDISSYNEDEAKDEILKYYDEFIDWVIENSSLDLEIISEQETIQECLDLLNKEEK